MIGVATGTVLILKSANTSTTQTQTQTQAQKDAAIKATAEDLMTQSAKATDAASAKALLLQAREKYVQIDDKDRADVRKDLIHAPAWIADLLRPLTEPIPVR